MSSDSTLPGHLWNVAVILGLGIVYVAALAVGTVASRVYRWFSSIATSGRNALGLTPTDTRQTR